MPRFIFWGRRRPVEMRLLPPLILTVGAVATDQVTKWIILTQVMTPPKVIEVSSFFNLVLTFNTGVSFGLLGEYFATRQNTLAVLSLTVVAVLLVWAIKSALPTERRGLGLIAGGALGNILDRWRQGAVTDFLDFHWQGMHWPTFNAADIFIFLGAVHLLASALLPARHPADG